MFFLIINQSIAEENIMILKLKDGDVKIELFEDVAPNHVKRIKDLANSGQIRQCCFSQGYRWLYGSNWRCKIWEFRI